MAAVEVMVTLDVLCMVLEVVLRVHGLLQLWGLLKVPLAVVTLVLGRKGTG